MTMLENLAAVIHEELSGDPDAPVNNRLREKLTYAARAVLETLMEPSDEMLAAGDWRRVGSGTQACWKAMILAALEGK